MPSSTLPLAALLIATLSLTGCHKASSSAACPPIVSYAIEVQRAAAAELRQLPQPSAIELMLADYAVMRDQARACSP